MLTARRAVGPLLVVLAVSRGSAAIPESPPLFPALTAESTPRAQLERFLNTLAHRQLQARQEAMAAVTTQGALGQRRRFVRETVLKLMGGLPRARSPLQPRITGHHEHDGFAIENMVFDSLPGFPVTANVYRPAVATGRLPAIIASPGHGEAGKASERYGADLARKGFVVLTYDPLGQGERLQHFDPELRVSRAGSATEEHGQAAARAELIGESVARYFIWDAVRGLDYLASREDVDPERLGAVGCSGGGTVTTALAALDDRVKAAAIGCYITSWSALIDGPGPQEAEQSLAGFLAEGLDMADYVALIAPRPLLIVSTTEDFFPLEGARGVYQEGQRLYALAGAPDAIGWSVSKGGHGVSREGREAIAAFFLRTLRAGGADPRDETDARLDPEELAATGTGQVSTSFRAQTVAELISARAAELPVRSFPAIRSEQKAHRERVGAAVALLTGMDVQARGPAPELTVHRSLPRTGYRLDVVSFPVDDGLALWGLLAVPDGGGRKPAVLMADPRVRTGLDESGGDFDQLAQADNVVLAVELRGAFTAFDPPPRASLLGPLVALHRRAAVVGKSIAGMRTGDVLKALDVLAARTDVDASRIDGIGRGGFALPLLHAAVLDPRIARVALQESPVSYRAFLHHSIHKDLPEVLIPGVLRQYDVGDLILALSPRPVTIVNPIDAVGQPMKRLDLARYVGPVLDADSYLTTTARIHIVKRRRGDPFRWE